MRLRSSVPLATVVAVLLLAAAACGSSNTSTTTTAPPSSATTAAGQTGATTTSAAAGPATGAPIKIMTIATLQSPNLAAPQVETAVRARVAALNKAGGINGRPIEPEFCNDKFDPNEGSACARKAVDDKVVAVVGGLSPVFAAYS